MIPAIGINELISQRATPTTIITSKMVNSDIDLCFKVKFKFNPPNHRNCYIIMELNYIIHTLIHSNKHRTTSWI